MIELTKLLEPVPLEVFLSVIVGFSLVLQHTPLEITGDPPSNDINPPLAAVVVEILVTAIVVIVGKVDIVVKTTWFP